MTKRISTAGPVLWIALCVAWALPFSTAHALDTPGPLEELEESDQEALEILAARPEASRDAALEATLFVDVLVEAQRIQEQSSDEFQEAIEGLERAQQEQLWDLVREPGLLEELAGAGPISSETLYAIAERHPEKLAVAIRTLGTHHAPLLATAVAIQRRASDRFEAQLETLPDAAARQAFETLLEDPELLSMLARRVRLAVRLGDSYRADPDGTRRHLDALGVEVASREKAARDEWVKSIAEDPEAVKELEASARSYAEENGYAYDELTEPRVRTRVTVVVNPYPFWFGYPHWYVDAHLYPYGYWYPYPPHFGYYRDHGHFVWFGFPSFHFAHWFFGRSHHHRSHYAHLSGRFDRHYDHHRYARGFFHRTLGNWVRYRDHDRYRGRYDRREHYDARRDRRGRDGGGVFVSLFDRSRFRAPGDHRGGERDRRWRDGERRGRDRARVAPGPRNPDARRGGGADRPNRANRPNRPDRPNRDAERGDRRGDRPDARADRRDRRGDRPDARADRRDRLGDEQATPRDRRGGERAERRGNDQAAPRNRGGNEQAAPRNRGGNDQAAPRGRGGDQQAERRARRGDEQAAPRARPERSAERQGDRSGEQRQRIARPDAQRAQKQARPNRESRRESRDRVAPSRRDRSVSPAQRDRGGRMRGADRGPRVERAPRGGGNRGGQKGGGNRRGGGGQGREGRGRR